MKRRRISEAEMTLQSAKADKPEKTGEMPSKYKLTWLEFNNDGEVVEKDKSFESLDKYHEFKLELEADPNFLQIQDAEEPSFMDEMPGAKSEEMEKVKIKESQLKKFIKLVVMNEIKQLKRSSRRR